MLLLLTRHCCLCLCLRTQVGSIWIVAAGTFQWAETIDDSYRLEFHQALYFMLIEVVGRPRIPTNTSQGYVVAILVVLVVIVIVPYRLVQLAEALRRQSMYTRQIYTPRGKNAHVILSGHVTVGSIYEFTSNFFHEDVGEHSTMVVILSPDEPSPRMRALLNHPTFTHRVTYVQGSLDMSVDLERCRADIADAAFLLADKMPMREEEQHRRDLLTISNVLTLKSFSKRLQLFVLITTTQQQPLNIYYGSTTIGISLHAHEQTKAVIR